MPLLTVGIPLVGGLMVWLISRRLHATPRRQGHAASLTMFWLTALMLSLYEGQIDLVMLPFWLLSMSVWAIGIIEGIRWLDRKRGRGYLWE